METLVVQILVGAEALALRMLEPQAAVTVALELL
jgi:hypothetical protein